MKINGYELEFNSTDTELLRRLSAAEKVAQARYAEAQKLEKDGSIDSKIESLEMHIGATKEFFDAVFGDGTAAEVFGTSTDAMVYLDALAQVTKGTLDDQERAKSKIAQFRPNRATRRSQ